MNAPETVMTEYIEGFNAGYGYVLEQIERHPRMTTAQILEMLKGEEVEMGPSILPSRIKDKHCD